MRLQEGTLLPLAPATLASALRAAGAAGAAGALLVLLQLCAAGGASTVHRPHHHHTATTSALPVDMRIVNGDDADIVDYPFQVSIERFGHHSCGGAIISKQWIISAAHCFLHSNPNPNPHTEYRVRVGTTKRHFGGSMRSVERIVNHPSADGLDYDVSLLRVAKPLEFGQVVQQIELPVQSDSTVAAKHKLVVTGYGAIGENARLATRLLKADLSVWTHKECQDFYREKANATISDRMFCAGSPKQDACQGDSGGPISDASSGTAKLLGVVSFGMGCGRKGFPGVYANLAHKDLRTFIKNTTGL